MDRSAVFRWGTPNSCDERSSAPTYFEKGRPAVTVYATSSDLLEFDYSIAQPVNVGRYLSIASGLVDDAMVGTIYYLDDATGLPARPNQLAAVKEAVCAQVANWISAGVDPTGATSEAEQTPVSATLQGIGSVTFGSVSVDERLLVAADQLSSEAWRILRRAGLIRPVIFG